MAASLLLHDCCFDCQTLGLVVARNSAVIARVVVRRCFWFTEEECSRCWGRCWQNFDYESQCERIRYLQCFHWETFESCCWLWAFWESDSQMAALLAQCLTVELLSCSCLWSNRKISESTSLWLSSKPIKADQFRQREASMCTIRKELWLQNKNNNSDINEWAASQ